MTTMTTPATRHYVCPCGDTARIQLARDGFYVHYSAAGGRGPMSTAHVKTLPLSPVEADRWAEAEEYLNHDCDFRQTA